MADSVHKVIAVIGSANPKRNDASHQWPYEPRLRQVEHALDACEQLGAELARAGWDIVVYAGEGSNDEGFIEPAVVRGYLSAGSPRTGCVRVLYSRHYDTPRFTVRDDYPDAFDYREDMSTDWEPSFFRSLGDVDAALIVGGGHSSYLAGLVCLGRKIPLLAVATFGAAASRILDAMAHSGTPLSRKDFAILGRPEWSADSARLLVASIASQRAALDREREDLQRQLRTRRRSHHASVALGIFVVASLIIPTALVVDEANTWGELVLLFIGPIVAGASGGTVRTLLPRTNEVEITTLGSAALGAVAGGITGLLYLTAQLTSSSETSLGALSAREYHTFVLFSVALGFVAGLALDSVYQKLVNAGAAEVRDTDSS